MFSAAIRIIVLLSLALTVGARGWAAGDPCPSAIDALVPDGSHYENNYYEPTEFGTMSSVHAALNACPNITSLTLRAARQGCTEAPDRWSLPFDVGGTDKYPTALRSLSLDGYRFNDSDWEKVRLPAYGSQNPLRVWDSWARWFRSGKHLKWWHLRRLPEEQLSKKNIELWMDAMNFSSIQNMSINHRDPGEIPMNAVQLLTPKLSSLNSLAISGRGAEDFILGLRRNSLSSLDWVSCRNISAFEAVLQHHGASLTNLSWHSYETLYSARPLLSADQLQHLAAAAPNLKSLVIDMGRNGSWPWDHLHIIATEMQALTDLTLYFDLASECRRQKADSYMLGPDWCDDECRGAMQYAEPRVNSTSTLEVIKFLLKRKAGRPWANITFRSGDWSPPWDGALYFPDWLDEKTASVEYRLRNNDVASCLSYGTALNVERDSYCRERDPHRALPL